jgi:hypothetical protein
MRKQVTLRIDKFIINAGPDLYVPLKQIILQKLNHFIVNNWYQGVLVYSITGIRHSSCMIDYTGTSCDGIVSIEFDAEVEEYERSDPKAVGEIIPSVTINEKVSRIDGNLLMYKTDNKNIKITIIESDKKIALMFSKYNFPIMIAGEVVIQNHSPNAVIFGKLPIVKPLPDIYYHLTTDLTQQEKAILLKEIEQYELDKELSEDELEYKGAFYAYQEEQKVDMKTIDFIHNISAFKKDMVVCYTSKLYLVDHIVGIANGDSIWPYSVSTFSFLAFCISEYKKINVGIKSIMQTYGPLSNKTKVGEINRLFWDTINKEKPKN